jgi:hypothetical protein
MELSNGNLKTASCIIKADFIFLQETICKKKRYEDVMMLLPLVTLDETSHFKKYNATIGGLEWKAM